jgi:hypothetical protein
VKFTKQGPAATSPACLRAIQVHRCAELIASLTGAAPLAGLIHGMLARATATVAVINRLIRSLVILEHAVCPPPGHEVAVHWDGYGGSP